MHHIIYLKVWGGDEEEAHAIALDELNTSVEPGNEVGWDYLAEDNPIHITKSRLQSEFKVKTFAELEKKLKQEQRSSLKALIQELRNDVFPMLAPIFMTKNDAPLALPTENDEIKKFVEELLKRKKDTVRPETFQGIEDAFLNILVSIAKRDTGHSMAMWRMNQIKKLHSCIEYPTDTSYTLQCSENNYAELPCDNKKGLSSYFYHADRHL